MNKVAYYYKMLKCIDSCINVLQLESCGRMINNLKKFLASTDLAEQALQKRCELLTDIYNEVE